MPFSKPQNPLFEGAGYSPFTAVEIGYWQWNCISRGYDEDMGHATGQGGWAYNLGTYRVHLVIQCTPWDHLPPFNPQEMHK